jgi:hypothetical protein
MADLKKPLTLAELDATCRAAEKGDAEALAEMRGYLEGCPDLADSFGGNMARQAQNALIESLTKGNALVRLAMGMVVSKMRSDLLGAEPTVLERLAVERVVSTWVHLTYLERIFAFRDRDGLSVPLALYFQRAISQAERRHATALTTLARLRKLAAPVLRGVVASAQEPARPRLAACPGQEGG